MDKEIYALLSAELNRNEAKAVITPLVIIVRHNQ